MNNPFRYNSCIAETPSEKLLFLTSHWKCLKVCRVPPPLHLPAKKSKSVKSWSEKSILKKSTCKNVSTQIDRTQWDHRGRWRAKKKNILQIMLPGLVEIFYNTWDTCTVAVLSFRNNVKISERRKIFFRSCYQAWWYKMLRTDILQYLRYMYGHCT